MSPASSPRKNPSAGNRIHAFFDEWYREFVLVLMTLTLGGVISGVGVAWVRMDSIEKSVISIKDTATYTAELLAKSEANHEKLEVRMSGQEKEIQQNLQRIIRAETRLDLAGGKPNKPQESEGLGK